MTVEWVRAGPEKLKTHGPTPVKKAATMAGLRSMHA